MKYYFVSSHRWIPWSDDSKNSDSWLSQFESPKFEFKRVDADYVPAKSEILITVSGNGFEEYGMKAYTIESAQYINNQQIKTIENSLYASKETIDKFTELANKTWSGLINSNVSNVETHLLDIAKDRMIADELALQLIWQARAQLLNVPSPYTFSLAEIEPILEKYGTVEAPVDDPFGTPNNQSETELEKLIRLLKLPTISD